MFSRTTVVYAVQRATVFHHVATERLFNPFGFTLASSKETFRCDLDFDLNSSLQLVHLIMTIWLFQHLASIFSSVFCLSPSIQRSERTVP